jgi:ribosomal-protein-alanine N-acetyltransferase
MTLRYEIATASTEQIYSHLKECDKRYCPPLSSRIDLLAYAIKLSDKSITFEAWEEDRLVGMVNAYLNDLSSRTGFITNVSVVQKCAGLGVGSALLEMCFERARKLGIERINLEVSRENSTAIRLYTKAGFRVSAEHFENLLMEYKLLNS